MTRNNSPLKTSIIVCSIVLILLLLRPLFSPLIASLLVYAQNSESLFPKPIQHYDEVDILELRRKAELYDELEKNYIIGSSNPRTNVLKPVPIIVRAPSTPYGTLIIGAGSNEGVKKGEIVFFDSLTAFGTVDTVYKNSARVVRYSHPDRKTRGYVKGNIPVTLVGQGAGSFEFTIPQQVPLLKGDLVYLPNNHIVAEVVQIRKEEDTTLTKVLARSPYALSSFRFLLIKER